MTSPTPPPPRVRDPVRPAPGPEPDPGSTTPGPASTPPTPAVEPVADSATQEPRVEPAASGGNPGPAASDQGFGQPGRAADHSDPAFEQPGRRPEPDPAGGDLEGDVDAWPHDEAFHGVELDDRGWVRRDLEAILLVADEPVPAAVLSEICGSRLSEVEELLVELAGEYARDGRGFVLRTVAGGWRLYTHPGTRTAVEAFLRAGQQSRLTRAALETLAVIAYRQPVTRFQVAAVRGVNVDGVFRTLLARGLIREVGTDPGPGQAGLYGTTPAFLEQLGLNALDQLPPLKDYLPEGVDLAELQEQA
jgi:segregation and condensation protein B